MIKFFKKILLAIVLLLFVVLNFSADIYVSAIGDEEKEYCSATIEDEFSSNEIIIALTNQESLLCKEYSIDDFAFIGCKSLEDLSKGYNDKIIKQLKGEYVKRPVNLNSFNRLIKIQLEESSKENVLNCIKILESKKYIKSANPNYLIRLDYSSSAFEMVVNDPMMSQQWAIDNVGLQQVWEDYTTGSSDVIVGIIDSGINANQTDLVNRVNVNLSRSFDSNNSNPLTDEYGHGTFVAGIIGAKHNNFAIAGVCEIVTLVSLKISLEERLYTKNIAEAIEYAGANSIDVLNISWNCEASSDLKESIENFPGIVVCSAGNDNMNISDDNGDYKYPAKYTQELNNVISVGGSNNQNQRHSTSNFSSFGYVDIFAPGANICSLTRTDTQGNGGTTTDDGTSYAAPYVTGVIALMMAYHPCISNENILNALYSGSNTLAIQNEIVCTGNRRLSAIGAFEQLQNHNVNYTQYSSTHHQVYCYTCNGYFLEQHEWVLRQPNGFRAIINPISWICNKCGLSQL